MIEGLERLIMRDERTPSKRRLGGDLITLCVHFQEKKIPGTKQPF